MTKVTLILCFSACFLASSDAGIMRPAGEEPWDYLILAQLWPGTSCLYFQKECVIPRGTKGWTIHGLWPSSYSGKSPKKCNESMHFNYTEIKPLRRQLDVQWPSFNKSGDHLFLWKHEWNTHGTCAYDLPVLQGERKYFNTTLQLHSHVDMYSALSTRGITPSQNKAYDLTEIFLIIADAYKKVPQIRCCCMDDTYYLAQVYLCYDKTLNLIDCPEEHKSSNNKECKKKTCSKKASPSLYFDSMKSKPHDTQNKMQRGYFIDCPEKGGVYYYPFSASQTMRETIVEFYEISIESDMQY